MEKFLTVMWILSSGASLGLAATYQHEFNGVLEMPLFVGTPPQGPFNFQWTPSFIGPFKVYDMPEVPRGTDHFAGFNPLKSTTFQMGGIIPDGQFRGTDVFQFGKDGTKVPKMDVKVMPYRWSPELSLRSGSYLPHSFIGQALAGLGGDFTVVMAFKQSFGYKNSSGTVVLGDANPSVCQRDWAEFPADYYMGITATDLEIGKTHIAEKFQLLFKEAIFSVNRKLFNVAAKELGIDKQRRIDCGQKKQLKVRAGRLEWTVGPETYMEYDKEENQCYFAAIYGEELGLPLNHLNGMCMRYDYKKRTVSFATLARR